MFSSIILFGSFFLFLALGVPIAFVLIVATVSYALLSTGDANLALVPQRIIYGINSFTMLCLPFFALAGNIMNHGGITMRLVRFAQAFVGHIKGGLAMVDILVCMMFGTVSGSAVAGTAAVGCLMIPAMKDEKYDPAFTAGLTACASCCCPIIPPSLAFVIYGAAAKVSVGDMFIAGVVPGILMGLIMMLVVYVFAVKRDFSAGPKTSWKEKWEATRQALPCIGLPIIVVGGIMGGFFTPTEAAAAAVLYSLILSAFVYRTVGWKELWKSIIDSAIDSGTVMLIVGGCYLFGWVISNERWAVSVTNMLVGLHTSLAVKLLLVNLVLLVVGMFMDITPAILIFTPIFLPIAQSFGMTDIQFGVMLIFNMCLGNITPPVGSVLFVGCGIENVSIEKVTPKLIPYFIGLIILLMLITFVPELSLGVPKLMGLI